jgi:hypothetical protein
MVKAGQTSVNIRVEGAPGLDSPGRTTERMPKRVLKVTANCVRGSRIFAEHPNGNLPLG